MSDAYADVPDRQPVMHRTMAGELGSDGWCLAQSTRGNFSVMLPGKYNDSLLKIPMSTGGLGVMHSVVTKAKDGADFNATYAEMIGPRPEGSPVDAMVNRFKELGGTITKKTITLAGLPAEHFHVEAQGTTAEFAILKTVTGDYLLAAQTAGPITASLRKDIDRFVQSLKITRTVP